MGRREPHDTSQQHAPPIITSPLAPRTWHLARAPGCGGADHAAPHVTCARLAPLQEEDEERRRQRGTHVLNPATNRLERLGLGTALLGAGAGGHVDPNPLAPQPHRDERPQNVDELGVARGRCLGCENCEGYTRRDVDPQNPNDVEALNCRRCGCACHRHEQL